MRIIYIVLYTNVPLYIHVQSFWLEACNCVYKYFVYCIAYSVFWHKSTRNTGNLESSSAHMQVSTVLVIGSRQTGHVLQRGAQSWHVTRWPHGKNTVLTEWSMQILQVRSSFSRRFISFNCLSEREKKQTSIIDWLPKHVTRCSTLTEMRQLASLDEAWIKDVEKLRLIQ